MDNCYDDLWAPLPWHVPLSLAVLPTLHWVTACGVSMLVWLYTYASHNCADIITHTNYCMSYKRFNISLCYIYGGECRGHSEGKKEEEDGKTELHKLTQLNHFVTKSLLSLQCCLCTTDIIIKRTMSETLIAMEQCSCIDISYLKWHYQCYFNI